MITPLLYLFAPGALISACYLLLLDHRFDYAGHFMAGFGGTLLVLAIAVAFASEGKRPISSGTVLGIVAGAVLLGVISEATTFRLAKFDEIDLFNQTLGALIAGLGLLPLRSDITTYTRIAYTAFAVGFLFLAAGFHYAFK